MLFDQGILLPSAIAAVLMSASTVIVAMNAQNAPIAGVMACLPQPKKKRQSMTPLNRPLSGDTMRFDLNAEIETTRAAHLSERAGRGARTLLKEGPLRVTLIVLGAGGETAEHSAEGPITIQVLQGAIRLDVGGHEEHLSAGHLMAVRAGIRHNVRAEHEAAFLLTVTLPQADG